MDPVKIRREYGEEIALYGGIDKRSLAADKKYVRKEVYRKIPRMIELGGSYVPTVDHTVPPDVPLEIFFYYIQLKRKFAEEFSL